MQLFRLHVILLGTLWLPEVLCEDTLQGLRNFFPYHKYLAKEKLCCSFKQYKILGRITLSVIQPPRLFGFSENEILYSYSFLEYN